MTKDFKDSPELEPNEVKQENCTAGQRRGSLTARHWAATSHQSCWGYVKIPMEGAGHFMKP
jgi:hypothetical protein